MAGGNISSEKIDLLIYGPSKPIVDNGFSDQFVLHCYETTPDLERLPRVDALLASGAVEKLAQRRTDLESRVNTIERDRKSVV